MDRRRVSFMHSYPNLLPLPVASVQGIVDAIEPFPFDRVYGGWWQRNILSDAKTAVLDSARRYQELIAPDGA